MTPASHSPADRLVYIQYLRGIAALLVVFHHLAKERGGFFSPFAGTDFGLAGVLIFFVISGFVMMHSCRNEPPATFVTRRLIRVVPLYALMTLVYFLVLLRSDIAAAEPFRRVPELLLSLLFIPHRHSGMPDEIWPILVPGWTLNFEMFFFAIFAVGIAARRVQCVPATILALLVLAGLAYPGTNPLVLTWTSPLLLLFLAGMGLAGLWSRMDFARLLPALPVGMALCATAAMNWLPADLTKPGFYVGAVLVVAGTLAAERRWPRWNVRPLARIGDASYSIYLSHTILMIPLYKALVRLPLKGWTQLVVVAPTVMLACTLAGIALYQGVERPMLRYLNGRFGVRRTTHGSDAAAVGPAPHAPAV